MKRLLTSIVFISSFACLHAQHNIETRLFFSDTTNYPFTEEWQYLSTDIYLLNATKFGKLINETQFEKIYDRKGDIVFRPKKGISEEKLEYLFISAELQNVKFFGDKNMMYPLYNFQVNKDRRNQYHTYVSDNIESVRIIDNLPLYSAKDRIDAKIEVRAITQSDRDVILGFIGSQLRSLASLVNPTTAVFSLIGEFGNFIESNSRKKEYRFTSTIRLFEQKNFDTRLHSIHVYTALTANSDSVTKNFDALKIFLDTTQQQVITRNLLSTLLDYEEYPLIIVANYKSLYKMETITGDEVNMVYIDRRKVRLENNYTNGLISEDTYRQEKNFISFLTAFAMFKSNLEMYRLNFKMGNTDAAMNGLSNILQQYRLLLKTYDDTNFKYRESNTFQNIFKQEYLTNIEYAGLYLEEDHNLKSVKDLVRTMISMEQGGIPAKDNEIDNAIRYLHFSDGFKDEFMEKTQDGQLIRKQINEAEEYLYKKIFEIDVQKLLSAPAIAENMPLYNNLKEKTNATACIRCRERSVAALLDYNTRYEENLKVNAVRLFENTVRNAEEKLLTYVEKTNIVAENFNREYGADTTSVSAVIIGKRVQELKRDVGNLSDYTQRKADNLSAQVINRLIEHINDLYGQIDSRLAFISDNFPALLQKHIPTPPIEILLDEEEILLQDIIIIDTDYIF